MRALLIACLLPLCVPAQPTPAKVQSDIAEFLKPGHKLYDIEERAESFNAQWSKITGYKAVNCRGDLCVEKRFGLVHKVKGDTLFADFHEIALFNGKIFLSWDSWACLTDDDLKVTHVFSRAQIMSRYFIAAANSKQYGVLDTLARQVIPPKYDSIQVLDTWTMDDDKTPDFIVKQQGKWGVVDFKDSVKIKPAFEALINLGGFAGYAGKKGKYAYVSRNGTPATQFMYDSMFTDWSMANFIIMKGNKIGLMGMDGKELVKPVFTEITRTSSYGCRCAKANGKYAVISSRGVNLSGFIYDDFKPYQSVHDEMLLRKNGKWGFFGCRSKKEISPFIYDGVVAFYGYEADMMLNGVKKKIRLKDE